jgi:multidrug efflux pump subunit AcrA (membrane-fusion protein)
VAGDKLDGVVVPRSAVVRHEGKGWVYLQTGEDAFVRREIELDRPTEAGWFVPTGITAKDRVVVTGAQTIFSVELNGSGYLSGARD